MEFLVVSDSKLKIMLTKEDMRKYGIDKEDIDYDDPKVRRAFWQILDVARADCGFEVSGDKVLIQFYPSKDGSEIFVTKLGVLSGSVEKTIARSNKVTMLSTKRAVYRFSDLDSLVAAVHIIEPWEFERAPRAFFGNDGDYYVVADERCTLGKCADISKVLEYGVEVPGILAPYVAEHATEIDFSFLRKL